MSLPLSFILVVGLLGAAKAASNLDREALVSAAIQEVKEDFAKVAEGRVLTTAEKRLKAFKKASAESLAQGMARLSFERMVRTAEHKILEKRRQQIAATQRAEDKAESLALELFHKPGSILKSEEIARMYEESECRSTLTSAPSCTATTFRTPSGVCNNLQNPTYGSANTLMRRLIPPRYDDGISRLRGTLQIEGSSIVPGPFSPPTPSPRVVSLGIVRDRPVNDSQFSHILMQWGQFMDHDLNFIPEFEPESCHADCKVIEDSCVPFPVPQDDTNVQVTRGRPNGCHGFRRSLPACDTSTPEMMTTREQVNGISHFIDGSMVYNHNKTVFDTMIRNSSSPDGLLNVGPPAKGTNQPSLPMINSPTGPVICMDPPCFLAGDLRVNEQTALTVMHTIWIREHNRIARVLRANNRQMSSDEIFETARSIVIAEIQKITYKDYLPLLLGSAISRLIPKYKNYDPNIFPNVPNAFAAAAYRFGHSQIQPFFERLDENYQSIPAGPLSLVDSFFNNSQFLEHGGTDPILRGLLATPARQVDEFLNTVITTMLFASGSSSPGMDLASLNIQRGRDHGLPTYLTWKQWAKTECNLESDFRNQLTRIRLLQTYGSLNNVDLFVGGLAEEPVSGGIVGATFACIFSKTFTALRDGDRFYYESSASNKASFTAAQISEIEKASLSRVICDNSGISQIQRNAFMANQRRVSCSRLQSVNINVWSQSSAPSLPKYCYIKVQNELRIRNRVTVFSRLVGNRRYCRSRRTLSANSSGCFVVLCPQANTNTELAVTNRRKCSAESTFSNLKSKSKVSEAYKRTLTTADFSQNDGLYTSSRSCRNGKEIGVLLCGGKSQAQADLSEDDLSDIDSDTDVKFIDEKELKESLSEDILPDHLNQVINGGSEQENKLVGMMEDALSELSEDTAENDEKEERSKEGESNVMKKLEDALNAIE